ncbi:MAG: hypothetical protein ACRD4C_15605 [Candidatus Acidiferrales bacterium]
MPTEGFTFSLVEGHKVDGRAIGFLEQMTADGGIGSSWLGAKKKFISLRGNKERHVRKRFDLWLAFGRNDHWFHGWPNDEEVKDCFCFKWEEGGNRRNRLYGFLCHPQPKTNASRQVCVLALHQMKNDWSTDRTLLRQVAALKRNKGVQASIAFIFSDNPASGGKLQ